MVPYNELLHYDVTIIVVIPGVVTILKEKILVSKYTEEGEKKKRQQHEAAEQQ